MAMHVSCMSQAFLKDAGKLAPPVRHDFRISLFHEAEQGTKSVHSMPSTSETTGQGVVAGLMGQARAVLARHGGPIAALAVRVTAAGLAYILQITIARFLGTDEYGVFAYTWAWVQIAGFGATFGFGQIAVRFLAEYSERNQPDLALGFIRTGLCVVGGGSIALALAGILWLDANPDAFGKEYHVPLILMFATVPMFAIGDLAEGYARSHGWSLLALAPPYILRQVLMVLAVPAIWLMGLQPTATLAIGAALAATALTALMQLNITLGRLMRPTMGVRSSAYALRQWFNAAWPVFLGDVAQVLRQNADLIILAMTVEPAQIALYYAATRVASMLGLIEFAVGAAAAHRFARIDGQTSPNELTALVRQSCHLTFWPTLLAALAISALAGPVLSLFGEAYLASQPVVWLLAAGYAIRALIGPAEELLIMRGHGRSAMLAQFIGLEMTVILSWQYIPQFGIMGAAIGMFGALVATTATLAFCCKKLTGALPLPLPTRIP